MALSDQVKQSLNTAEENLREALAFSARNEKPFVNKTIAEMIQTINNLIHADEFFDQMESIIKNQNES